MDDYISKPVRLEALTTALSKCSLQEPEITTAPTEQPSIPVPQSESALDAAALQELKEMAGEEASEIVVEVINCYLEDSPKLLDAITQAITEGNAEVLRRSAHSLRSSSASLGATSLSQLSKELEYIGRGGNTEGADVIFSQAKAEYERVEAALRSELQAYM